MRNLAIVALGTLALAACRDPIGQMEGRTISMAGAGVALGETLDPYDTTKLAGMIQDITPYWAPEIRSSATTATDGDASLARAIARFERAPWEYDPSKVTCIDGDDSCQKGKLKPPTLALMQNEMRDARNTIQGMLLAHSTNLCNAFKLQLREQSASVSFGLGSFASILGAAGAIVSGTASRALSGSGSAFSGVNAEYSKDILSSLTTSVIIPGIDKQRSALIQGISSRRCLGISSYPLSVALQDALFFHSACSTDTGIAAAGSALVQHGQSASTSGGGNQTAQAEQANVPPPAKPAAVVAAPAAKPAAPVAPAAKPAAAVAAVPPAAKLAAPVVAPKVAPENPAPNATSETAASNPAKNGANLQLVGTAINIYQCEPLDANGILAKAN